MPRQPRVFVDGATYHVYCRVGRGEPVFKARGEASELIGTVRDVKERHRFAILAWCIMSNHYHLVLRCGSVPLWRTMRLIQGRYSKGYNRRERLYGALWQGRYKAKLVVGERHLQQVIAYVHLNPVAAGTVKEPARYTLSGHTGLLGNAEDELLDVDEALLAFGDARESARMAYARAVEGATSTRWVTREPGQLPWWGAGRREEKFSPPSEMPRLDGLGASSAPERRALSPDEFIAAALDALDMPLGMLGGPHSGRQLTRTRELLAAVGVESFGIRVKDLADRLGKNAGVVSRWANGGAERRSRDDAFRERAEQLVANVRALSTPTPAEESAFVSGMSESFID